MKSFNFFKPYQFATVAAGESGTVFSMNVPKGNKAFIKNTGNSWFIKTYLNWRVDGELVEKVERRIASVNSPRGETPPIIAIGTIEWVAVNNDAYPHVFEVLQDGIFVPLE